MVSLMFSIAKALETEADQSLRDDGSVDAAFADAPREELLEVLNSCLLGR